MPKLQSISQQRAVFPKFHSSICQCQLKDKPKMRTVVSAFVEMFLVIKYLTSNDLIKQPSSHLAHC